MRKTLVRGARLFSYTPVLGLAAAVSFGKLIVYAQFIGVEQFGALGKMLLVSALFGMVGSLGLQSAASRDLPVFMARGQARRGLRLLAQTLAVTSAVAAIVLLSVVVQEPKVFDLSVEELVLGVLHGWAQQMFLVAAFDSRSRLNMMGYARDMAARSLAIALMGALAGWWGWGARGVAVAETLGTLCFFGWVAHAAIGRADSHWRWWVSMRIWRGARLPWRAALVLLAGGAVMFVSLNLDRWVAAEVLPRASFGAYTFAWLTVIAAQSVQGLLNSGLMPLLAHRRATGREAGAFGLTWIISLVLLAAGLISVVPAAWILDEIVKRWMPQFMAATPLFAPLLLAAVFRVSDFWSSLLVVTGKEGAILIGQLMAVSLAGGGYVVWLHLSTSAPSAISLTWLALASALVSHGVSAVSAYALRTTTCAPPKPIS